jgi:hypothetical protein
VKMNEQDLRETEKLFSGLQSRLYERKGRDFHVLGFEMYTGTGKPVRSWPFFNARNLVGENLVFLVALSRHPVLYDVVKADPRQDLDELLIEEKILTGYKVLDLGCGNEPTLARVSRALGADVYTVDRGRSLSKLLYPLYDCKLTPNDLQLEDRNHITLDLRKRDAVHVIREQSGGNFDVVVEANLLWLDAKTRSVPWPNPNSVNTLALDLLREGGVYRSASANRTYLN